MDYYYDKSVKVSENIGNDIIWFVYMHVIYYIDSSSGEEMIIITNYTGKEKHSDDIYFPYVDCKIMPY